MDSKVEIWNTNRATGGKKGKPTADNLEDAVKACIKLSAMKAGLDLKNWKRVTSVCGEMTRTIVVVVHMVKPRAKSQVSSVEGA